MRARSLAICFVGVFWLPSFVFAQNTRAERPYRGLFASGLTETKQSLIVSASAGGGYDDNLLLDASGIGGVGSVDPRIAKSGQLATVDGSIVYAYTGDRGSFGSSASSMLRYYTGQRDPSVAAHNANVRGTWRFGRRTTLAGRQSAAYQPYTFTSIFPTLINPVLDEPAQIDIDQATSRREYLSVDSAAELQHSFNPRLDFNSGYNFQKSDTAFFGGGKFTRQGARAGIRYSLTRNLGLRAGYGYQEGRYPNSASVVQSHNIDAGIDYNRALSFSRRTTVAFGTGTATVTDGTSTSYQATGFARVNHEMGRTWYVFGSYNRSVQFVDLLLVPVLYDSMETGLAGLLNRRVEFQTGLRASIGDVGLDDSLASNDFDTFQAITSISIAMTRFMQFGASYSFYRYRFEEGTRMPLGVPQNIDRQSVRAQVSFWAPLIQRSRR